MDVRQPPKRPYDVAEAGCLLAAGLVYLAVADAHGHETERRHWNSPDRSSNKLRTGWALLHLAQVRLEHEVLPA